MSRSGLHLFFMIGYDLDRCPWATRPRAILGEVMRRGYRVTVADLEEPEKGHPPIHPPIEESEQVRRMRLKQRFVAPLDAPLAMLIARRKMFHSMRQADLVHIQKPKLLTWTSGRLAKRLHKPILYDWDDLEGTGGIRTGCSAWRTDRMDGWFARNSRAIVAASTELEHLIRDRFQAQAPIILGPCGVDLDRFDPMGIDIGLQNQWREKLRLRDEPVLIYHGQMEMAGGAGIMLDALSRMKDCPWSLLLVGGGPQQQEILRKADEAGIGGRIKATGYVPFDQIPVLLSLADGALALFPDHLQARCKSPLKIYEAMAMGLPIIASDLGQPGEALRECARLVQPDRADILEEALRWLLKHPDEAAQLGMKARIQAEMKHSWKILAEKFILQYQDLAKNT